LCGYGHARCLVGADGLGEVYGPRVDVAVAVYCVCCARVWYSCYYAFKRC
jgi:hypothetical protein